jgi:hypothetical protein
MDKLTLLPTVTPKLQWKLILALDWADRLSKTHKRSFDFILGLSKQIHISVEPITLQANAGLSEILISEFRHQVRRSLELEFPHQISELQNNVLNSDTKLINYTFLRY